MKVLPERHMSNMHGATWTWGPFRALYIKRGYWFGSGEGKKVTIGTRFRAWAAEAFNLHFSKRGLSWNEGGVRGGVVVCYWSGPFAPFFDCAVRIPYFWVGAGWSRGPYKRVHRTMTWKIA